MTRPIVLAVALSAIACGPPPHAEEPRPMPDATPPTPAWAGAPDALSQCLREVLARVAGARPVADLEIAEFVAARSQRAHALVIPAGTCWTIVASSSSGMRDLDARLFEPSGELVAEDAAPDPRPVLQACADAAPRALWLVIDAYDGAGAVLVGALASERSALPAIAAELGIEAPPAPERARSEIEDALARRGMPVTDAPLAVVIERSQTVRVPLRSRAGRCQTVLVRARDPELRVAVRILDLAGAAIAIAEGDGREAIVQRCEESDVERAIEIAATEGAGTVDVAIAEGAASEVGGPAALWLGRLPERDAIASRRVLARGEATLERVRVPRGCARVLGRGGVEITSEGARVISPAEIEVCGPRRTIEVIVVMRGGAGGYRVDVAPAR